MGGEHSVQPSAAAIWPGSPPHGRGTPEPVAGRAVGHGLTPAWAGNTAGCARRGRRRRAHPRMGGEHPLTPTPPRGWLGSPPHGRGTPSCRTGSGDGSGLTPAWAGNTAGSGRCAARRRAHPRMGGEHQWIRRQETGDGGSPPHGRGTRPVVWRPAPVGGLTPAWAGNTCGVLGRRTCWRAHPRMGGEHDPHLAVLTAAQGSPPHGRGTPLEPVEAGTGPGLTPAWAGNTP